MNGEITIDRVGRVVLPKAILDALGLKAGDSLKVETDDDRLILSPIRGRAGLQNERGVWVFRSGALTSASIPELIDEQRSRRTEENLGSRE